MVRFFRVSLLAAVALAFVATGAFANIPIAELSDVPDALTMSPDGSFAIVMTINGAQGPVVGAFVEVEFSLEASGAFPLPQTVGPPPGVIAWSDPIPPLADVPVAGPGGGFMFTGNTDANGEVRFFLAGGGCVAQKNNSASIDPYIAQVRADNFLMNECVVNNPDAVNTNGELPEDLEHSICAGPLPIPGTTEVGLSDALYHTPQIKQGLAEICSKFTAPYDGPVGLGDAGVLTPYVKAGTSWTCTYVGP